MHDDSKSAFLARVYTATTRHELEETYDQWAEHYDAHVTAFGYTIPAVAAGFYGKYVAADTFPLLDAGAGTGLMGGILDTLGYHGQVGIDMSAGMLDKAKHRGVYAELHRMILGEPLHFPSNAFGACQSIGVFTAGHAPATAFEELVRVVRGGGHIIFSVLAESAVSNGYDAMCTTLEQQGKWQLVEQTKLFSGLPLEDPTLRHRVAVYRVCEGLAE